MRSAEPETSRSSGHLVLMLMVAMGGAVYQYGQRQHEVSTLCAGLTRPLPVLDSEQRAAHEAARAVCKSWVPRPKRKAAPLEITPGPTP
ncbi:UNVERIFIED_ORG: hypothetical protein J2W74_002026 [Methylorubrum zatmanii]